MHRIYKIGVDKISLLWQPTATANVRQRVDGWVHQEGPPLCPLCLSTSLALSEGVGVGLEKDVRREGWGSVHVQASMFRLLSCQMAGLISRPHLWSNEVVTQYNVTLKIKYIYLDLIYHDRYLLEMTYHIYIMTCHFYSWYTGFNVVCIQLCLSLMSIVG